MQNRRPLNTNLKDKISTYDITYDNQGTTIGSFGITFGERKLQYKLLSVSKLPNNTILTVPTGLSSYDLFHYFIDPTYSFAFNQGGARYPIPYIDTRNHSNDLSVRILNESSVEISSSSNWSTYAAFICICFTET